MYYFYSFLITIFNACLCAHLAKKKGRNPRVWFMGGAFFGLFALAAIFFVPKQKIVLKACELTPPAKLLKALVATQECKFWYYLDEKNEQFGPMSFEAVTKAWNEGRIQAHTFLWNEDLEGWKRLEEVTVTSSTL
jgi:hypothetical protein